MSELQTRFIDETYCEYYKTGKHDLAQVYLKSEADKVIADLEESHKMEVEQLLIEIVKLKNEIEVQKRLRDMALASVPNVLKVMKIIQHQKYKRCLAMAKWCEERSARYDVLQERHNLDWGREIEFYYRWYMRWLELAKQFKEAK